MQMYIFPVYFELFPENLKVKNEKATAVNGGFGFSRIRIKTALLQ